MGRGIVDRQGVAPVPAVVIGGHLNGLGVCRSLAKAGVPVHLIDGARFSAGMWSRSATPVRAKAHGRALLETLRSISIDLGQAPALIIADELAVLTVSEFRDELAGLVRIRMPKHDTVLMLHDKALFHEFAAENGFPVPRGVVVRNPGDISQVKKLRFPLMIKPADKRTVHSGRAPRGVIAADWERAEIACRKLHMAAGNIIVQERIEGPDSAIHFCLFYRKSGAETAMFTGRKLLSTPPGVGSTAFCTGACEARETLESLTKSLLERIDYSGFGSVEYKWDSISERFVIIEPTVGRTNWQEEIATLSGMNLPFAGYCYECGRPPPIEAPVERPVVWQASYIERLKVGFPAIPPGSFVVDGYWRHDDPMPALVHYPWELAMYAASILARPARSFANFGGHREAALRSA
jgi:predicted ATP-grasp superfamily ATP-dependent carboligase